MCHASVASASSVPAGTNTPACYHEPSYEFRHRQIKAETVTTQKINSERPHTHTPIFALLTVNINKTNNRKNRHNIEYQEQRRTDSTTNTFLSSRKIDRLIYLIISHLLVERERERERERDE